MPIRLGPHRRVWLGVGVVVLAVAVTAGILAIGLLRGWFDSSNIEGTSSGFEPTLAPRGASSADSWPEYGFDAARTRANPALRLHPPFRRTWEYDAGALLEFPPVIAAGRAVVGTNAGVALAIDLRTGREQWRRRLQGRVASSPALAGDLALFTTTRGRVIALTAATGAPVWERNVGSAVESSPLIVGDSAFIGTLAGRVMRLDVHTGGVRWSVRASGAVKASLALAGHNLVVGDYSGHITAFRSADGATVWKRTSPGQKLRGAGRFYGGPAVAYGRVFIGNVNGRVIALDQHTGEVAWVRVLGDFVYASPAVADRTVYVGSYDKRFYALDAVTGRVRWRVEAGERISGSASVVGDVVYFSTIARRPADGRTFGLDARTGRRLLTQADGRYSPAVGIDGLLVLTGVHTLYGLLPR